MRAACGWERGRSGQGKYNEEASGSWVVNAWGSGRSRSARDADKQYAGGGRGRWARSGGKALRGGQLPRAWREGATWSYSEPKVGNFRIFAPPIHVAALWPVAFGFRGDSNNRTECAVVLIRFANLKNEETNRNKDNCTFGSVV